MIDFKYPEGATPIDPDEAEGLLLTHITTHGELNRWEQDNIVEALAWVDKTNPTNILNEQFIKQWQLHSPSGVCKIVENIEHLRRPDAS